MKEVLRISLLEALFWFLGNFIYGVIPLAVVAINSTNKFIGFLDEGYLVFLSSALAGSIGIDVFLMRDSVSGFVCAFINIWGYLIIVYTSVMYLVQTDNQSGFNDIPFFQFGIILCSVIFCIFIKAFLIYKEHTK